MMKNLRQKIVGVALLGVAGVIVPHAFGLGFDNPDQDARATGQGEAFVAQADDASAIYYNPAGLTQIKGTEITSGMEVSFPDSQLRGGGSGEEMNTMATIPHLYASSDFGLTIHRAGLVWASRFLSATPPTFLGPVRFVISSPPQASRSTTSSRRWPIRLTITCPSVPA